MARVRLSLRLTQAPVFRLSVAAWSSGAAAGDKISQAARGWPQHLADLFRPGDTHRGCVGHVTITFPGFFGCNRGELAGVD